MDYFFLHLITGAGTFLFLIFEWTVVWCTVGCVFCAAVVFVYRLEKCHFLDVIGKSWEVVSPVLQCCRNVDLLFCFYFPMGNLGCLPQGKPALTELLYPTSGACWVCFFYCFHNSPNSDVDYGIFNMCTAVNACDCAWEYTDTVRVCTESWLREKNPCRTGELNLRWRRAVRCSTNWATSPPQGDTGFHFLQISPFQTMSIGYNGCLHNVIRFKFNSVTVNRVQQME